MRCQPLHRMPLNLRTTDGILNLGMSAFFVGDLLLWDSKDVLLTQSLMWQFNTSNATMVYATKKEEESTKYSCMPCDDMMLISLIYLAIVGNNTFSSGIKKSTNILRHRTRNTCDIS